MAEGEREPRKLIKPIAAAVGVAGTMASIWWFALKPRRKSKKLQRSQAERDS